MIFFEKNGIPTVTLTANGFQSEALATGKGDGLKQTALAVLSSPLTNLSPDDARKAVDATFDNIVAGLTMEPEAPAEAKGTRKTISFNAADRYEAFEEMNSFFLRNGWGDGFPLIPPTPEKVDRMLAGTKRPPNNVVTILLPGMGEATVEKIAVNAVMAGCLPEHMPVLIAALLAMMEPRFNIRSLACSTGPHAPFVIINGPIAKELNINFGRAALGPGVQSLANTVIGRAIRLIMMNVGHTYVGELDMDTIGSPNKYSMCLAENEDASPWEPYHVEHGFRKDASTVTVFPSESFIEVTNLRGYTADHVLETFAGTGNSAGAHIYEWLRNNAWQPFMLIAPEHAKIIGDQGWTKEDIKEYMYHNARIEWRYIKHGSTLSRKQTIPAWQWLYDAPDDTPVPIVAAPDWFHILVVGGPVGKSAYLTGVGAPVTVEIER